MSDRRNETDNSELSKQVAQTVSRMRAVQKLLILCGQSLEVHKQFALIREPLATAPLDLVLVAVFTTQATGHNTHISVLHRQELPVIVVPGSAKQISKEKEFFSPDDVTIKPNVYEVEVAFGLGQNVDGNWTKDQVQAFAGHAMNDQYRKLPWPVKLQSRPDSGEQTHIRTGDTIKLRTKLTEYPFKNADEYVAPFIVEVDSQFEMLDNAYCAEIVNSSRNDGAPRYNHIYLTQKKRQ